MFNPYFHLILISFFPVLSLFSANLHQAQLTDMIIPLSIIIPFNIIYFKLLNLFIKNKYFSSIIASLTILVIFSHGHIRKIFKGVALLNKLMNGWFLSVIILMVFSISLYILNKNRDRLKETTKYFNILSVVLFVMPLIAIVIYLSGSIISKKQLKIGIGFDLSNVQKNINKPDVYYFILDRYARTDSLKTIYDFDNSSFTDSLKKEGFYIAENSWSNYHSSAHSIASSLNMRYLDSEIKANEKSSKDWKMIYYLIQNHQAGLLFHKLGYDYYHFGSWWWPTTKNPNADKNINIGLVSEFSDILISNTIFYPLAEARNFPYIDSRYTQWRRINYQFNALSNIPEIKTPTFVFAHLIIPHEPYVFNKDGSFLKIEDEKKLDDKDKYKNQITFLNGKLEKLVKDILTREKNSVIILQADEGPYPDNYEKNKNTFNWNDADRSEIEMKMAIFNAVYFPDKDYSGFNSDSTPVNTLRIVLNKFEGFNLSLLPDFHYIGNMKYPFKLIEVKK